jgi:hypothetical protein
MKTLVFKTNVQKSSDIEVLEYSLNKTANNVHWNFDLEDCDKILRIETDQNISQNIITLMNRQGFFCEELQD